MSEVIVDLPAARKAALRAALLDGEPLPSTPDSVIAVARHFGGIQIDPTRTVERTQHLVLWSRVANYDRALLDGVLAERSAFEYNAFIVTPDRLPELMYHARIWPFATGDWSRRARQFMDVNAEFRRSILDQLRANGPLQSRQIDDSTLRAGWESTGWTHGKNTARMLEFMSVRLEVAVAGRVGQERLWDLPERVIPADAPRDELTQDEYEERRVMRAIRRFGVATLGEIRLRAYGLSVPRARALLARLVEDGRLTRVDLALGKAPVEGYADPEALDQLETPSVARTTLVSPFDPLVYDRERTERIFDFSYRLEMYKPREERQFGHFVLPIVHDRSLVGRLDSARDRKTNELVVKRLHWEAAAPDEATRTAVDGAIADLATFVRAG